jgi:acyl-homoserine lactone synthase
MEATGQLVYPEIMGGAPIPRGPDIYEWTRTCIAPERRDAAGGMDRAARLVFCGVAEACVMLGIRGLTVETDPLWITRFLELGWRAKPLALPVEYEGESLVPIYVDVDETTLERCRGLLGVAGPVLTVGDDFEPSRIPVRGPADVVASN